ncbi:MAG TPA: Imm21 family immunity protein [Tepidisphaeraceae bacterium]|jgi:hypothetical protein
MDWIESAGGPLILLARSVLPTWGGCESRNAKNGDPFRSGGERSRTDYDLACDVNDYLGVVAAGPSNGLVLGDEPLRTYWFASLQNQGGWLVRWDYADDESSLTNNLHLLDTLPFKFSGLTYSAGEADHVLFDSAIPGLQLKTDEALQVTLVPDKYTIDTASFMPDTESAFLVHRLRPNSLDKCSGR